MPALLCPQPGAAQCHSKGDYTATEWTLPWGSEGIQPSPLDPGQSKQPPGPEASVTDSGLVLGWTMSRGNISLTVLGSSEVHRLVPCPCVPILLSQGQNRGHPLQPLATSPFPSPSPSPSPALPGAPCSGGPHLGVRLLHPPSTFQPAVPSHSLGPHLCGVPALYIRLFTPRWLGQGRISGGSAGSSREMPQSYHPISAGSYFQKV